jgi:hypothetical protein
MYSAEKVSNEVPLELIALMCALEVVESLQTAVE